MTAIAAIYSVILLRVSYTSTQTYSGVWLSDHQPDVLYGLGMPFAVRNDTTPWLPRPATNKDAFTFSHWAYTTPQNAHVLVDFAPDGGVSRIECQRAPESLHGCDRMLNVGIGTNELDLEGLLGAPSGQSYVGDSKTLSYDDLGIGFSLRQYNVESISLHAGSGGGMRLLRLLIP